MPPKYQKDMLFNDDYEKIKQIIEKHQGNNQDVEER